ncbi:tumor necrosis factor alpha-induced protein 2-like [Lampris incognitus]|uniref:tumor necrosis factor alpha-induced protein 2-like n=1 Tax=Lampris incognitus TaxID=2546036 RepID=UPI0024B5F167|nr:tumor necrosis factor alpha-induced protein 2-like [Lampris incognitus]
MRTRSGSSRTTDTLGSTAESDGKPNGGRRFNLKLPKLRGNAKGNTSAPDVPHASAGFDPVGAEITFEENMARGRLSEASRQLIVTEERLCGEGSQTDAFKSWDDERNRLAKDREALACQIERALKASLDSGSEKVELLRSAVDAMCQEEAADGRWANRSRQPPAWRPSRWRERHNVVLRDLVEERMESVAPPKPRADQSCMQQDLCELGKRVKEDLRRVVQEVKGCYPPEFDICKLYAVFYHQAFGARLKTIADFMLDDKDSTCLLRWATVHYRNILESGELVNDISSEELGDLLPEEMLEVLEEQYLTKTQVALQTCITKVLEEEEKVWQTGKEPEKQDGIFISPLAIDVIQFINGAVQAAEIVLRGKCKAEPLTCLLKEFLQSFQKYQDNVLKRSSANSKSVVMANLICVEQFREYISKKPELFSKDVEESCLSVLTAMKKLGHAYLLNPIHKEMKPQYKSLGTKNWLENRLLFKKVLDSVEGHIQDLRGLTPPCHQELMGQLHLDVTVEYVKRLLKRNVKLKNKDIQRQGSEAVSEDGQRLHDLFAREGSKDDWLNYILPKIAELLRLQDLSAMQMEVAVMGAEYPDLSTKHVSALLKLKSNMSKADRKKVKEALLDGVTGNSRPAARPFFSNVLLK